MFGVKIFPIWVFLITISNPPPVPHKSLYPSIPPPDWPHSRYIWENWTEQLAKYVTFILHLPWGRFNFWYAVCLVERQTLLKYTSKVHQSTGLAKSASSNRICSCESRQDPVGPGTGRQLLIGQHRIQDRLCSPQLIWSLSRRNTSKLLSLSHCTISVVLTTSFRSILWRKKTVLLIIIAL